MCIAKGLQSLADSLTFNDQKEFVKIGTEWKESIQIFIILYKNNFLICYNSYTCENSMGFTFQVPFVQKTIQPYFKYFLRWSKDYMAKHKVKVTSLIYHYGTGQQNITFHKNSKYSLIQHS